MSFENSDKSRTFTIRRGKYNCNSKCAIYRLICKPCDKQYIGSTQTAFRLKVNNYKSHFRSFCERQNAGIKEGFMKFQIIDSSNTEPELRIRKSFWQHKLNTFLQPDLMIEVCQHYNYA